MQANIITAEEAGIDNKDISSNALDVVQKLQDGGYQAYLVGGCVRDLLLDKKPKDFDVVTNATPEEVKACFKRNARIIGRRFKLVHVRYGYEVIEVATFRADGNDRDNVDFNQMSEGEQGQLLRDNVFGTIEEDVVRRDFRANALYYDSVKGEVLDFMNGLDDIKEKKLISIGEPIDRFKEDPVRMLRVIRFSAKLGFTMEPEALSVIEEEGKLLSHVSPARLFEEVLKLFHGGAAYETYLLLRKNGLFKYLFPFTDQIAVDGVEGMPERALRNTDKRIGQGKPVIPAFLFACMLWDPVKADAQVLMDDGTPEPQAWRIAMSDALRDQNQYVAVPRRLADIILDIWNIHFRLIKQNPRMVKACLNNRRFRAAFDFLLLRTMVHEVDEEIGQWWDEIQTVDDHRRDEMISEISKTYKQDRKQKRDANHGESDGNNINYNSADYNPSYDEMPNYNSGQNQGQGRQGQNRSNQGRPTQNRSGQGRRKPTGDRRSTGPRRGQNQSNSNNSNGGGRKKTTRNGANNQSANQGRNQNRNRNRSANTGRGAGRNAPSEGRYQEAIPKDDYGNHSSGDASQKKVKVRRKRRIVPGSADKKTDETPHF